MQSCLDCKDKLTRQVQIEIVSCPHSPGQRVRGEIRYTGNQAGGYAVENL